MALAAVVFALANACVRRVLYTGFGHHIRDARLDLGDNALQYSN